MKTIVEKWTTPNQYSFVSKRYNVKTDFVRSPEILMRTHAEYEISVLTNCSGKRFVGNTIENFTECDLFLIGPHLLHAVQPDDFERGDVITVRFLKEGFGSGFFDLPENEHIACLLHEARRGVAFASADVPQLYQKLQEMVSLTGFERMMAFFRLLHLMARNPHRRVLSSNGFSPLINPKDHETVNQTYEYIVNRFADHRITLGEISDYVNMSPTTFCRYFKKHFRKTFTTFLNEVRVGHACKMLQQTNKTVAEIAFASGYNQLTHFNRQFKRAVGYSPTAYRNNLSQQIT
ncbi:AraC family transcriptional regulator [Tunicatimonas pelagia]|uniref:AraC family transcriptional regulator n=1 Tax=Tunicatimonas pelagia TaxID=931531 RepID=UPI002664F8E0|nr:AraC family transcriptional regulator [Tunicatimonas pelagia]WKN45477.1 AraC family transcriptional regulator [Tunicatimonas pelagia]